MNKVQSSQVGEAAAKNTPVLVVATKKGAQQCFRSPRKGAKKIPDGILGKTRAQQSMRKGTGKCAGEESTRRAKKEAAKKNKHRRVCKNCTSITGRGKCRKIDKGRKRSNASCQKWKEQRSREQQVVGRSWRGRGGWEPSLDVLLCGGFRQPDAAAEAPRKALSIKAWPTTTETQKHRLS